MYGFVTFVTEIVRLVAGDITEFMIILIVVLFIILHVDTILDVVKLHSESVVFNIISDGNSIYTIELVISLLTLTNHKL